MAYRAEIEIGVKGAAKLEQLKKNIQSIDQKVDGIRARWEKIRGGVPTKEFGEVNKKLQKTTALQARANALAAATEKRLKGQSSVTKGLLGLNKAVLNAARSEAQARGESVAKQRALNRELAKSQQYSRPIGPQPQRAGAVRGRAGAGQLAGRLGAAAAAAAAIRGVANLADTSARTSAELSKLGLALEGVLGKNAAEGFKAIDRAARDFNQPIVDATRNFTQLSAAAVTNGNSIKQTETLYRALSAATKATGGDAEDLNGVLRAATQVISKGVVRSEELRGQIGDRLPGAFQLFAQATNRSAEELQKALEQGEVSADEFVTTFADFILNKYEPAAKKIGDSPAEAGARLTKALEDANLAAGPLLAAIGAKFQNFATDVIKALTPVAAYIQDLFNFTPTTPAGLKKVGADLSEVGAKLGQAEQRLAQATNDQTRRAAEEDIASLERRRQKLAKEFSRIAVSLPSKTEGGAPLLKKTTVEDKGLSKADKSAARATARAAREEEKLQERLAALRVELNLIETNADFKSKITAAEIAGNKELVIRLQNLQEINTIQANEEKALIRIKDVREINLRKEKTAAEINAANVEAAAKLALIDNQRQQAFDKKIESLNFEYSILTATTVEERKQLQIAQQMAALKGQDFTPEQLDQIKAAKERLDIGPIQNFVNELQLSLSDTETMVVSLAQSVENSLATAMSSAVETLITGTGSVKEAFSDMFANIGKAFIDMATQMLAQQAILSLLQALGGGISGGGNGAFNIGKALTGRATGGPVSANTPYIVGERGPELMIPSSQGRIVSNENLRSEMDRSTATQSAMSRSSNAGAIDVRYSVERINNVDYVTASEFQQGMAQAAKQGAIQGEQRAMRTLKNSASTRRSVGF